MAYSPTRSAGIVLDLDGVLIPFDGPHDGWGRWERSAERSDLVVSREAVEAVEDLGAQVHWATSWAANANAVVSPFLGWPELEILEKRTVPQWWKLGAVEAFLRRAPYGRVVWVDDDLDRYIDDIQARLAGPLASGRLHLVCPDSAVGLTRSDLARLTELLD